LHEALFNKGQCLQLSCTLTNTAGFNKIPIELATDAMSSEPNSKEKISGYQT